MSDEGKTVHLIQRTRIGDVAEVVEKLGLPMLLVLILRYGCYDLVRTNVEDGRRIREELIQHLRRSDEVMEKISRQLEELRRGK